MVRADEVRALPAASRATARSAWAPSVSVVVSSGTEYGAAVSGAPTFAPSTVNWTLCTPTLSEAFALTVVVPLTTAPLAGAVSETVGSVVSGTTTSSDAVGGPVLPSASAAITR
jgi:hypothetical protein